MNELQERQWVEQLANEFQQPYFKQLQQFVQEEYATQVIFPPQDKLWSAFEITPFSQVKVVILGQDPYHGAGQANGLSFSVAPGQKIPPSLRNMYKELIQDIGCEQPISGDLTAWAEQGVLLMNTVLTVREGQAHSHKKKGWELFTDAVISRLSAREQPVVFVLWGKPAQQKIHLIDDQKHAVIQSYHPSPLSASRGFLGSRPYSKVNEILQNWNEEPIQWCKVAAIR